MLGSRCCCPCPAIIPYRYNNAANGYEEYDIPESVEVDIAFSLPQDELFIETRKDCCPGRPATQSYGVKYKRPQGGLYSLLPTGFPYMYEYVSRDLRLRAELSSQYYRNTQQNILQTCLFWAWLEVWFGSANAISRSRSTNSTQPYLNPVTDAELTAGLSGYSGYYKFARFCRQSTRNFQNIRSGGCVVGEWDELYQLTTSEIGPETLRLPRESVVPLTAVVTVPAIPWRLAELVAGDPCFYVERPPYPCYTISAPGNTDPAVLFSGTTLVSRTWQAADQGLSELAGTLTINSAVAKRTGLPDITILDIP